jgi:hypothetical protein
MGNDNRRSSRVRRAARACLEGKGAVAPRAAGSGIRPRPVRLRGQRRAGSPGGATRALLHGVNDLVSEHAASARAVEREFAGSKNDVRSVGERAGVVLLSESMRGRAGVKAKGREIEPESGFQAFAQRKRQALAGSQAGSGGGGGVEARTRWGFSVFVGRRQRRAAGKTAEEDLGNLFGLVFSGGILADRDRSRCGRR